MSLTIFPENFNVAPSCVFWHLKELKRGMFCFLEFRLCMLDHLPLLALDAAKSQLLPA
jgi:hypothetical protein